MVNLVPANIDELRQLIWDAYKDDTDLIDKYQAGDRTFEECVDFNAKEIAECSARPSYGDMTFWKVVPADNPWETIGYSVLVQRDGIPGWLFSFAINIKYRSADYLQSWLDQVESVLGLPYYTALWDKNSRAIEFFKKNNFVPKKDKKNPFTYLFNGFDLIPQNILESWQLV